jgi:hypothetical protein
MKNSILRSLILTITLVISGQFALLAQGGMANNPSPAKTATGKIGAATVTINYSSPSVRGRTIWGDLVPYDKVWRAGANEATVFETDKDLMIEGKKLAAGKYSIYAIPGEKEWQVIFNTLTGQWGIKRTGETTREEAKDALVVKVKPKKSATFSESLVYVINGKGFSLKWANLEIPVAIK